MWSVRVPGGDSGRGNGSDVSVQVVFAHREMAEGLKHCLQAREQEFRPPDSI